MRGNNFCFGKEFVGEYLTTVHAVYELASVTIFVSGRPCPECHILECFAVVTVAGIAVQSALMSFKVLERFNPILFSHS